MTIDDGGSCRWSLRCLLGLFSVQPCTPSTHHDDHDKHCRHAPTRPTKVVTRPKTRESRFEDVVLHPSCLTDVGGPRTRAGGRIVSCDHHTMVQITITSLMAHTGLTELEEVTQHLSRPSAYSHPAAGQRHTPKLASDRLATTTQPAVARER